MKRIFPQSRRISIFHQFSAHIANLYPDEHNLPVANNIDHNIGENIENDRILIPANNIEDNNVEEIIENDRILIPANNIEDNNVEEIIENDRILIPANNEENIENNNINDRIIIPVTNNIDHNVEENIENDRVLIPANNIEHNIVEENIENNNINERIIIPVTNNIEDNNVEENIENSNINDRIIIPVTNNIEHNNVDENIENNDINERVIIPVTNNIEHNNVDENIENNDINERVIIPVNNSIEDNNFGENIENNNINKRVIPVVNSRLIMTRSRTKSIYYEESIVNSDKPVVSAVNLQSSISSNNLQPLITINSTLEANHCPTTNGSSSSQGFAKRCKTNSVFTNIENNNELTGMLNYENSNCLSTEELSNNSTDISISPRQQSPPNNSNVSILTKIDSNNNVLNEEIYECATDSCTFASNQRKVLNAHNLQVHKHYCTFCKKQVFLSNSFYETNAICTKGNPYHSFLTIRKIKQLNSRNALESTNDTAVIEEDNFIIDADENIEIVNPLKVERLNNDSSLDNSGNINDRPFTVFNSSSNSDKIKQIDDTIKIVRVDHISLSEHDPQFFNSIDSNNEPIINTNNNIDCDNDDNYNAKQVINVKNNNNVEIVNDGSVNCTEEIENDNVRVIDKNKSTFSCSLDGINSIYRLSDIFMNNNPIDNVDGRDLNGTSVRSEETNNTVNTESSKNIIRGARKIAKERERANGPRFKWKKKKQLIQLATKFHMNSYKCLINDLCIFTTFSLSQSMLHAIQIHSKKLFFHCNECNAWFAQKSCLNRHMKRYHVKSTINCASCTATLKFIFRRADYIRPTNISFLCYACRNAYKIIAYKICTNRMENGNFTVGSRIRAIECNDFTEKINNRAAAGKVSTIRKILNFRKYIKTSSAENINAFYDAAIVALNDSLELLGINKVSPYQKYSYSQLLLNNMNANHYNDIKNFSDIAFTNCNQNDENVSYRNQYMEIVKQLRAYFNDYYDDKKKINNNNNSNDYDIYIRNMMTTDERHSNTIMQQLFSIADLCKNNDDKEEMYIYEFPNQKNLKESSKERLKQIEKVRIAPVKLFVFLYNGCPTYENFHANLNSKEKPQFYTNYLKCLLRYLDRRKFWADSQLNTFKIKKEIPENMVGVNKMNNTNIIRKRRHSIC